MTVSPRPRALRATICFRSFASVWARRLDGFSPPRSLLFLAERDCTFACGLYRFSTGCYHIFLNKIETMQVTW